jgi:hypothetical protein
VLDAVCKNTEPDCDTQHLIACRTAGAADQVVPTNALYARSCCESACEYIRADLLAIATELEAE